MGSIQMDYLQGFAYSKDSKNQNFKLIGFQKTLVTYPLQHAVCLLLIDIPKLQEASYLIIVTIESVVSRLESLFNHVFVSYLFGFLCSQFQSQENLKAFEKPIDQLKRLYLQD